MTPNTPQAGSGVTDAIRAAGGIVHSDGNIFFTNRYQFEHAASLVCGTATIATPPVGAGGAGVMDARPDSFHSDSGECGRVQGPEPRKSLNAKVADLLRPFLKEGQKVIWREAFRWHDDNGVLSNHYDGMELPRLSDDFGYGWDFDFDFHHAAIVTTFAASPANEKGPT